MEGAATRQHAHPNTVFHCLYGYYNLGFSKAELAHVYNKSERTISNWIAKFQRTGTVQRQKKMTDKRFTDVHRRWLLSFYTEQPLAFLDEAQKSFKDAHGIAISTK